MTITKLLCILSIFIDLTHQLSPSELQIEFGNFTVLENHIYEHDFQNAPTSGRRRLSAAPDPVVKRNL